MLDTFCVRWKALGRCTVAGIHRQGRVKARSAKDSLATVCKSGEFAGDVLRGRFILLSAARWDYSSLEVCGADPQQLVRWVV